MEVTVVKKEVGDEQVVKVEEHAAQDIATTVVLQNISEFGEVEEQIVSAESLPYILKNYTENSEGNLQIAQSDDGQYTYIIEHPEGFEEGTQFELADGEHYIIEEYQENYEGEEECQDSQYETVYIQHIEAPQEGSEVETADVYTVSEEIEDQYSEEDHQQDDDDDDQQMAIVEETEAIPEEHLVEEKPLPTIIQEKLQVQIKQTIKGQDKKGLKATPKRKHIPVKQSRPIKQEVELEEQHDNLGESEDSLYDGSHQESDKQQLEDESLDKNVSKPVRQTEEENEGENNVGDYEKRDRDDLQLIFECSICGKGFKTPTGVKRHISICHWNPEKDNNDFSFSLCHCCGEPSDSAHTTGDFKCDHCDKLFIQQNSFDRHVSIEHPDGDKYECYECKKIFKNKEQLIDHTRVHSLKSVKCEDCGREFTRKYHLDRHIGQTGCMGVPKQVYDCRVCEKSFTRKDNLAEHLKNHAGIMNRKKRKFTCEFCMKEFNGVALLNIHVRTHTGERPYGCDICEKKFPSSGAMKKHRRMHTGEKPYTCPQCGNKFAAKETLNRHWRTHTGEKPHQCKFCGKSFIQAAQLRAHIFHHTGENAYTCPHCNRAFNRKLRLTTHIKFMHEGADPLNCPHEGCSKTFFRKEDIHRHLMTHSGEKPYECKDCGKAFVVKSSLKIHQLTHRKEPPVSCEVCNRAFIRQDCLMRHMRARHRDVLEDIVTNAEKKILQQQLFQAVTSAANKDTVRDTIIWNELTLTESIKELLSLLVDEECLSEFGHPEAPVDKVLESVIKRCGHSPASEVDFDYIGKMRENAKLLFTVVIDDQAVKELLNNQTVDEVIMHVLKLAKRQVKNTMVTAIDQEEMDEEEITIEHKPDIQTITIDIDEDIDKVQAQSPKKVEKNSIANSFMKRMDDRIELVVQNADSAEESTADDDDDDEAEVDNPDRLTDDNNREDDNIEDNNSDIGDEGETVYGIKDEVNGTNKRHVIDDGGSEEVMEAENAEDDDNSANHVEIMEVDGSQLGAHIENAE